MSRCLETIWGKIGLALEEFNHVRFKMPVRHPGADTKWAVSWLSLEIIQTGEILCSDVFLKLQDWKKS